MTVVTIEVSHARKGRVQKKLQDFRLVILCYDIIPLLFPHYYKDHDVEIFADFFKVAFPLADLVVVTAKQIETDVKAYCADKGLTLQCTAIVPLGADAAKRTTARDMLDAHGLEVGRYILFVSTIEPRKGHRLAYQTWRQLLVEGVPQQQGYKLVFVGRPGWLVEDLLADIKADTVLDGTLLMLPSVDDAGLAQLYKNAAFCTYPSHYEGYGLPIIEAFSYGKAVIASTGGALPEVVGEFSPCLDPNEEAAWLDTMRSWIVDEAARAPYEAAIRERFKLTSWNEAAAKFFEAVQLIGRG